MITDDLFALKAETLAYFDRHTVRQSATAVKRLLQVALTESLYTARILMALGGQRPPRQVLQVAGVIRSLKSEHLPLFRALYATNRDVTIVLAEVHFGSRRGRTAALAANRSVDSLFDEIVNSNHAAIVRLRRSS
jgi:hypothetical protein